MKKIKGPIMAGLFDLLPRLHEIAGKHKATDDFNTTRSVKTVTQYGAIDMIHELCMAVWPELDWTCWQKVAAEMRQMSDHGSETMQLRAATMFQKAKSKIQKAMEAVRLSLETDTLGPLFAEGVFEEWLNAEADKALEAAESFDVAAGHLATRITTLESELKTAKAAVPTAPVAKPPASVPFAGPDHRLCVGLNFTDALALWRTSYPADCFHEHVIGKCVPPSGGVCTKKHGTVSSADCKKFVEDQPGAKWVGK